MGINYCLSTLKSSIKLLSKISLHVTTINEDRIAAFNAIGADDPDLSIMLETFPSSREEQMQLDMLLADFATTVIFVQRYQVVSAGIPLSYEGIDMYSPTSDDDEAATIAKFIDKTAASTGLISIMANNIQGDTVTAGEMFSTYRAIGCQSFTAFELAVHRAVNTVADRIWEMAYELQVFDEEKGMEEEEDEEEGFNIKVEVVNIKEEPFDDSDSLTAADD